MASNSQNLNAIGPTLVNFAQESATLEISPGVAQIIPFIPWCMGIAKAIIFYNVIFATQVCGPNQNRILDRFQGHIFDIKIIKNTTMARHFASNRET